MLPQSTISLLERRRIEAEIVGCIYFRLKEEIGIDAAQRVIGDAICGAAIAAGEAAAREQPGTRSLDSFAALIPRWQEGDALQLRVIQQDGHRFDFDVERCGYAEMYREMGLAEIGHLLSCNRDGSFCEGFDERLTLERNETIMQGHSRCTFRYTWNG